MEFWSIFPVSERFAIHKLIVADRRREGPDSRKARKDLLQAERLIAILAEDRPTDLAQAYEKMRVLVAHVGTCALTTA